VTAKTIETDGMSRRLRVRAVRSVAGEARLGVDEPAVLGVSGKDGRLSRAVGEPRDERRRYHENHEQDALDACHRDLRCSIATSRLQP
jgi:hypothetical protein